MQHVIFLAQKTANGRVQRIFIDVDCHRLIEGLLGQDKQPGLSRQFPEHISQAYVLGRD
jgi:hypothetical protein